MTQKPHRRHTNQVRSSMIMKILLFFFCFISLNVIAQNSTEVTPMPMDSTQVDSVKSHSFKKAMFLSAGIPGAGQIYNHLAMPKGKKKAYWKVPLIYAGLGTTVYFLVNNSLKMKQFKTEYENRKTISNYVIPTEYINYDAQGLVTQYKTHQTRRDLFIFGTVIVYALNIIDAGVEAHFINFDVSKNLSLSIRPTIISPRHSGINLTLAFK